MEKANRRKIHRNRKDKSRDQDSNDEEGSQKDASNTDKDDQESKKKSHWSSFSVNFIWTKQCGKETIQYQPKIKRKIQKSRLIYKGVVSLSAFTGEAGIYLASIFSQVTLLRYYIGLNLPRRSRKETALIPYLTYYEHLVTSEAAQRSLGLSALGGFSASFPKRTKKI
ncbi:hypothetical protein J6590_084077 [Homalodisca vitripennis]|nr:hypothetical protein J6590_084077 [Homalodisca vitripennis]